MKIFVGYLVAFFSIWAVFTVLLFSLLGCTTPMHWTPSTHQEMLGACRGACGKGRMASYSPMDGECQCIVPGGKQ